MVAAEVTQRQADPDATIPCKFAGKDGVGETASTRSVPTRAEAGPPRVERRENSEIFLRLVTELPLDVAAH